MGWWQSFRKKIRIRKKLYKQKRRRKPNPKKIMKSVTTLLKKKKNDSKVNVKDIDLINGLEANDLKKRFGVKGSKCKLLEAMVNDYKQGRLSVPKAANKAKVDEKNLDKEKLNKILADYDAAKTKKNVEDVEQLKNNIEVLKTLLNISPSRKKLLESMLDDLKTADRSEIEQIKAQLNPKIIDKDGFDKLLTQYETGRKKNRGISFLITKSKLAMFASKRKFSAIMGELKHINVSDYLKHT